MCITRSVVAAGAQSASPSNTWRIRASPARGRPQPQAAGLPLAGEQSVVGPGSACPAAAALVNMVAARARSPRVSAKIARHNTREAFGAVASRPHNPRANAATSSAGVVHPADGSQRTDGAAATSVAQIQTGQSVLEVITSL